MAWHLSDIGISIHSLHTERDRKHGAVVPVTLYFNPLSPYRERLRGVVPRYVHCTIYRDFYQFDQDI